MHTRSPAEKLTHVTAESAHRYGWMPVETSETTTLSVFVCVCCASGVQMQLCHGKRVMKRCIISSRWVGGCGKGGLLLESHFLNPIQKVSHLLICFF